ncbi:MAG: hypothetical protein V4507_06960 [Verrucomicrobiota bacterium]
MRTSLIFLGVGVALGALGMAGYNYFLGDHHALIEAQAKIEKIEKIQVSAPKEIPEKSAPVATSEVPKPIEETKSFALPQAHEPEKKAQNFMASMIQGQMKKMQQDKLSSLKTRLKLTPEQESSVQAILDAEGERQAKQASQMMSGEKVDADTMAKEMKGVKTLDQELDSILTPDQKTEYTAMKKDEAKSQVEMMATFETSQVSPLLGLNEQQKDQFYSAIYQAEEEMRNPEWIVKNTKAATTASKDPMDFLKIRDQVKLDAAAKVLTADQLDTYKKHLEEASALQKEMMQKFMPAKTETGTLSVEK